MLAQAAPAAAPAATPTAPVGPPAPAASAPAAPAPVNSALDAPLFYQLLLGEIYTQLDDPGTGFALMLDAARKTNDAALYQRAVEIALQARAGDSALQAARAWRQALPTSRDANRSVLQILISLNRLGETVEPLRREVAAADSRDRPLMIAAIPRLYARAVDKKGAVAAVEQALADQLAAPATGVPAWTAIGRLRQEATDTAGALEAVRRAQALDARAEGPALLALSLMDPRQPQAEALVRKYLDNKGLPEVRLEYARELLEAQRSADAMAQLLSSVAEKPDLAEAWLLRGALEQQDGKATAAETSFKRYLELASGRKASGNGGAANGGSLVARPDTARGVAQAYLALSQLAEQRKDYAEADSWIRRIDNPEQLLAAQLRRASLMARQGRIEEARRLIRSQPERTQAEARQKLTAEVQLLRDARQFKGAYDLLAENLGRFPGDTDLSYDLAMVAEKLGRLDDMERLLRTIISARPDSPHAYNALGYSLADRNLRLPEARQLIQKALELAPDDPFITDSLGWVEFRAGNLTEAQRLLQGAFKARPDAEIAAHLGEVLWTLGRKEQAQQIWREGLLLNAENETLQETLKRLRVKP
ncbi:MAG: tetratricopeptide repeat protein [Rhodoferax sp.]|nr:tetratricopeptide repeat protein [Rhodoferax sp.]